MCIRDSPYLLKIVNDMLIQAPTMSVLCLRLHEVLLCCRQAGIKLSLSKMDYGTSLKFAGFLGRRNNDVKYTM